MKYGIGYFLTFLALLLIRPGQAQELFDKELFNRNTEDFNSRNNALISINTSEYDVKYHRLEFEVDPGVYYLNGIVTTYFVPVGEDMDKIYFDFRSNMTIDSVVFHGSKLLTSQIQFTSDIELEITLGATIPSDVLDSISIFYQGEPINSGGFGIFRTTTTDCPQPDSVMWTLSEPYGSKNWWPCKETLNDKADSIDMIINTPSRYRVGSNGVLVNETSIGDRKLYHWSHRYPIPAYLVAFAVADYTIYSDTINNPLGGQIEVLNYIFHCDSAYAASQTTKLDPIMKFFIDSIGQYPYVNEKYGHAQCQFGGGMEHSTMSFMGGFSITLMAHELAHQWFGDKITCGSWQDIWLNEGFATYLEGMTCEQGIGDVSWTNWLTGKINNITSVTSGSVFNPDTTNLGRIFNGRLSYNKGAMLLHMLRWKLGDKAFFTAIRNYNSDPMLAYGFARTDDLIAHLEATFGQSLTEFFNDWFYGEGWPDYQVKWTVDPLCNKLKVNIQQQHSTGGSTFFEMPVPINFSDGSSDTTLVFHQKAPGDTVFYAIVDYIPVAANFDPDLWICAKHTINQETFTIRTSTWTGLINNDWNESGNWDCGIPGSNIDVIIPAGTTICIVKNNETVFCRSLIIEEGASVKVEFGSNLQITN